MMLRLRVTVLAVLLLAAPMLAGCLEQAPGDALNPSEGTGTDDGDQAPRNGSTPEDEGPNGSDGETPDDPPVDDDGNASEERGEYAPGWPAMAEAAVRPGVSVADGTCTANFVFSSLDNRTLYVGTAAHCVEKVELGQRVTLAEGEAMGVLVYDSWRTMDAAEEGSDAARSYNDFALLMVLPQYRDEVHPAMRVYGGPTGIVDPSSVSFGDEVLMYGNSAIREGSADDLDPHEGVVTASSTWSTDMYFNSPGIPGDSGSPVTTEDGRALGVLIHLEISPGPGSNDAVNLATALAYMEEHTDLQVELKTWPMANAG